MPMENSSFDEAGAFVEAFIIQPYQDGPLDGLKFAVKDNIDLAGRRTSYGSKPWGDSHADAVYHALCVEQLLGAGATCIGRTVADEFTYSLAGENHIFGTPLNPMAPERVPGGSSSGSASAVACGLADFSIGTDSAGSIRVPASFCGIWGMRPTLHRISEAGVLPFMPSVSTVGAFANSLDVLDIVMRTLLRSNAKPVAEIRKIYLLEDAFSLADPAVRDATEESISHLRRASGANLSSISASDILGGEIDLSACNEQALRNLQTAEFANTVGGWIEALEPELGPGFEMAYENVRNFDRRTLSEALALCEHLFGKISGFTSPGDLFCFPTTPTPAPLKISLNSGAAAQDFYNRTMAVTSFAGLGRLPEISIPAAHVDGIPVGVSLAAAHYEDEFLLDAARQLFT